MTGLNNLTFLGSGRVTYFLVEGLKRKNALPEKIFLYDPDDTAIGKVRSIAPEKISRITEIPEKLETDILFIAVHPPVVKEICNLLVGRIDNVKAVVSFAPSVTIAQIRSYLSGFNRIVRMIPNAPSIISRGFNPVAISDGFDRGLKENLIEFFKNWGTTPVVDEKKLEIYAILTGMGPTYLWFQILKLKQLAEEFGLDGKEAEEAIISMVKGAAEVLFRSPGLSVEEVLDLIPAHPLKKFEATINSFYEEKLKGIYSKIKT